MGYDAFTTIQAGINAVHSGGTVIVENGLYHESNLTVAQPMTIEGQSEAGVIIGPSMADGHIDSSFGGTLSNGFLLQSSGVTIENLTIDGNQDGSISGDHNFRAGIITDSTLGTLLNGITVQDVTVQHVYRRGINIDSGVTTKSTGHVITDNVVNDVTLGPGILVSNGDATITGNQVSNIVGAGSPWLHDATGIEVMGSGSAALVTIQGNTVTNVYTGIQVVKPASGSLIGGVNSADGNIIHLNGSYDDIGILVRDAQGTVTVQHNQISGSGKDAGIWLWNDGDATHPILLKDNVLTATASAGLHRDGRRHLHHR